jgi:general secretion pathway protein E
MPLTEGLETVKKKCHQLTVWLRSITPLSRILGQQEVQKTKEFAAALIRPRTKGDDSEALAKQLGLPTAASLAELSIDRRLMKVVSYAFVKRAHIFPVSEDETTLTVALSDPLATEALDELRFQFRKVIRMIWVPKEALLSAIHEYYQQDENAASLLIEEMEESSQEGKLDETHAIYDILEDDQQQPPAVRILNLVIGEAIKRGASDIHFDPEERGLIVRYRIDGVLHQHLVPPQDLQSPLITRVKVMAKMDIAERRLPQDGRVKMRMGAKVIDFRVSTLPVTCGERIVMRLLDKGNVALGLDYIGMPKGVLDGFRRLIDCSEGMILVTGPTGSGKTTTLYSALSELKSPEVNIMTIEDPVEYRLSGVAQLGVHPKIGLTFSTGLRHILRQDPDIIMIGEIRDKETAEIAIQSALTGHLVVSTLHTNDACSAVTRLVDMGIEPYLISSCCLGVVAQRLVRKICTSCGGKKTSSPCLVCLGSGFFGRHGMYEMMAMSRALRQQIAKSPEASLLLDIAKTEGLQTLSEYGKQLVIEGITTAEEVWRVTRGGESA